jgi:hypothetical protein
MSRQAADVEYVHTSFFTTAAAEELATVITDQCPGALDRVWYTGSGSEAIEAALKLARQYHLERGDTGRTRLIARRLSYHGNTLGALAAGGSKWRRAPYDPLLIDVPLVGPCFEYRFAEAGETAEAYGQRAAQSLEQEILRLGPGSVMAFVAETVVGATTGAVPPVPGYLKLIREICDRHDVLFAADEVITGFGRTGKWFGLEHWSAAPDIMQFAKAITSGYFPFGGVGVSDEIARALDEAPGPWMHAFTYSAHPTGCAVALRTLQIIDEENLVAEAASKGALLLDSLRSQLGDHPQVGEIRGKGLMCAVDFVKDRATKTPFAPEQQVGARIHAEAIARGLFSRVRSDTFVLAPPFVTPDDTLARIGEIIGAATKTVLG